MLKSTRLRTEVYEIPFPWLIQPLHSSDKDFILWMMNCLHYKDFLKITHYTLKTIFPLGNSKHFERASFKLFLMDW